ncbi:hypothetical protein GCM10009602_53340 [Nocardiopsis tropica]
MLGEKAEPHGRVDGELSLDGVGAQPGRGQTLGARTPGGAARVDGREDVSAVASFGYS